VPLIFIVIYYCVFPSTMGIYVNIEAKRQTGLGLYLVRPTTHEFKGETEPTNDPVKYKRVFGITNRERRFMKLWMLCNRCINKSHYQMVGTLFTIT